MRFVQRLGVALTATLALAASSLVQAQAAFPSKPIRLIVPFAPGGALDTSARMVAEEMTRDLGQPVIVKNKPGAAGTLGAAQVARANPDGYTLCWCPTGTVAITPQSDPNVPYDPLKDLVPVSHAINMDNVIMARKDLPANNFQELVELGKKSQQGLTFGTPGAGGTHHLGGEWLARETGMKLVHVPYKGEKPAVADLLGGHIDLVLGSAALAARFAKEGRIKVLANLGNTRSPLLPDLPTVAESGYPEYGWYNFIGVNAPAGTPAPVVQRLSKAISRAVRTPALEDKFLDLGFQGVGSTPQEYGVFLTKQIELWGRLLKATNVVR